MKNNKYITTESNILNQETLELLERSFIDDWIEGATGLAKEKAKGLANLGAEKIMQSLPSKNAKKLRLSARYKKEYDANNEKIEDYEYEVNKLVDEDKLDADDPKVKMLTNTIEKLKERNQKISPFIIKQPKLFNTKQKDTTNNNINFADSVKAQKRRTLNREIYKLEHELNSEKKGPNKGKNQTKIQDLENKLDLKYKELHDLGIDDVNESIIEEGLVSDIGSLIMNATIDKLSNSYNFVDNLLDKSDYKKLVSDLFNLFIKVNKKNLEIIEVLKKDASVQKNNLSNYTNIRRVYDDLKQININFKEQKYVNLQNIKLNPIVLLNLHYSFSVYSFVLSKFLRKTRDLIEELKDIKSYETFVLEFEKKYIYKLKLTSTVMYNKKDIVDVGNLVKKMNEELKIENVGYYPPAKLLFKEYRNKFKETEKYLETEGRIKQKNTENKTSTPNNDNSKTEKPASNRPDKNKKISQENIDAYSKSVKKLSAEKKQIVKTILNNFIKTLDKDISNEELNEKITQFLNLNTTVFSKLSESFAHIRWRKNPRTGLNKIVMTCKKGEFKKSLNREINIAGQKVKEVKCLPNSAKSAKDRDKDRKASIKRWRKIKANPSKMKKMMIKRQQTKSKSKTLR